MPTVFDASFNQNISPLLKSEPDYVRNTVLVYFAKHSTMVV
jgi:hypothetical protein